ncbi:MAG: hypothetical protein WD651_04955 [Acidimicrobiia bacterium]
MTMPRWWLALGLAAGLGIVAGCTPPSSTASPATTSSTTAADFVMVEGEGPGELAERIASQGLSRPDGTLRTLVSAEHLGTLELPGRTIHMVAYETGREGDTLPCLAMAEEESDQTSTRGWCGTSVPENVGVLTFETGGATEVLIMRVSIETETVVVVTSSARRITARPAGRVAYLEWPVSEGRGTQVLGLGVDGEELWSRILTVG